MNASVLYSTVHCTRILLLTALIYFALNTEFKWMTMAVFVVYKSCTGMQ